MPFPAPGFRSRLGQAKGHGSAKSGVAFFWQQKITAIALVPLTFWFVASLAAQVGADHASMKAWLSAPETVTLLGLLIVLTAHHAQLGLQMVIEDYIAPPALALAALIVMKLGTFAAAGYGLVSLLLIALKG